MIECATIFTVTRDEALKEANDALAAAKTFEEYLDFLDDYWELFGPLPDTSAEPKPVYKNIKI